ncbi:hypothetical protein E2L08_09365 [Palleronia sediminis]|uniref:Uncharacterized protein n=1 Tax=Palleronia sediminis TaxID=2547833 RepID=A0A4R6A9S6_9RHOB|nr:DUF6505 family protein [Palleronia sediminis]TDL79592.1 hypothetical protein E2L08_09365 [Palleronia sediminis]
MKLARTIRFDESDGNVFARPAPEGEWAIAGGFEFSNFGEGDLSGKARQAFANGWLSAEGFGRSTFVAVAQIQPAERAALVEGLAAHFVSHYGAPDLAAARPVAEDEIAFMEELCADHDPNTLLVVNRELTASGVRESFRAIQPGEAELDLVAVHVSED